MIIARFCDKTGKGKYPGSSKTEKYDGDNGWFPVESFQFGFLESKKEDDKNKDKGKDAKAAKPSPHSGPNRRKREFADCKITKKVDAITVNLMLLSMKERETKRGEDSQLEFDIHIVSSVDITDTDDRETFTQLMIHLESVNILVWDISGSGDNRPEETVSLRYDRGAMIYVPTPNAREIYSPVGPKGWNQPDLLEFDENNPACKFNWKPSLWKPFLPVSG